MPTRRIADLVLESATDYAIITTDLAGAITFWNVGAREVLGWAEDEVLGRSIDLIFTPQDRAEGIPQREMGDALAKGRAANERWHLRKDGSEFWASGEMLILRGEAGQEGFLKILRDRTAERFREDQLASSEARLALATEAAEIGIWDWDLATGIMTYSERAKMLCGFPSDHIVTFSDAQRIVHPEDLPRTSAMSRRALDPALRERMPYEYRIIRPDGQVRWVLAHGEAVFKPSKDGETAVRYLGTLQDITERMQLQQQLQESRSRLALAIVAGRMAVWELDVTTEHLTASPELNRLLGFPAHAEPSMEEIRSRYFPGERERLREAALAALTRGEQFVELEYRFVWPDQSVHWLLVRAEFFTNNDGQPTRLVGIVMDIDAQKRAQELQSVLNQELSHRLKNQLALVQGIVTQSLRRVTDIDAARNSIVERLNVLSQAHDLVVAGLTRKADLRSVVETTVHLHEDGNVARFSLSGPELEVGPRAALSLSLILHELATNAVKYGSLSAKGGQVSIDWAVEQEGAFSLRWREYNGPTVVAPTTSGFGTRLIRSGIAGQSSRVELDYAPAGVSCCIRVDLADLQAST